MSTTWIKIVIGIVVVAFVASLALFSWWFTIDQGERGVVLRNGRIIWTAEPGFHLKTPWIDEVAKISTQTHVWTETFESYSRDQQPATMALSVNFRANPGEVASIYAEYGSLDNLVNRVVAPRTRQATKTVFGAFQAATAISERARLNTETTQGIAEALESVSEIIIESAQIEDIAFSDAYENSIEQRMLAEVEVQKIRQNAEREKVNAEIAVTQANARADSVRAEAQANAEAIRLRGDAEGDAIRARSSALAQNPLLVELTRAERWNGVLPTTMLPNGTVPFLTTTKQQ